MESSRGHFHVYLHSSDSRTKYGDVTPQTCVIYSSPCWGRRVAIVLSALEMRHC